MEHSMFKKLRILAFIASTVSLAALQPLLDAQPQPTFQVGDRVEADPMLLAKWRPATVIKVYMADGAVNGYEVRLEGEGGGAPEEYTVGKTVARGIRPIAKGADARPPQTRSAAGQSGGNTQAVAAPSEPADTRLAEGGACSSDPLLTSTTARNDSLELSFKRAILANYQKRVAENSLSSPLAIGVNFVNLQVGKSRVNQRTLDKIDGTYIRSAPVGADIYPVRTTFTECERFRSEIIRTVVDGRYECFKNNFGESECSNASGWRTVETRREILPAR
jgi:hypothetical protein